MTLPSVTMAEPQDLLTVAGACKLLNVHPNTLRDWSNKGLIPSYRIGQRRDRRFATQDVLDFLEGAGKGRDGRSSPGNGVRPN